MVNESRPHRKFGHPKIELRTVGTKTGQHLASSAPKGPFFCLFECSNGVMIEYYEEILVYIFMHEFE